MVNNLVEAMEKAVWNIQKWPSHAVSIFHHNDTDGLTSGAILERAFRRNGYPVTRACLEKPYPAVLKKIFQNQGQVLVFADFAGRIAPEISKMNNNKNLVVILDHHAAEDTDDPFVLNLDPDLFGLKGDRDISASCTCYLFAKTLSPENHTLVHLAALGAVGDEFFINGRLVGENRKAFIEAVEVGLARMQHTGSGEQYYFRTNRGEIGGEEFTRYLDTLGAAGFYQNGPNTAVKVCLEGFSETSDTMVQELKKVKDNAFSKEISRLQKEGFYQSPHIQWFHVHKRFEPMGVKMIGVFCDLIKKKDFVDPYKYIAGFQVIPPQVPGFGKIDMKEVKISMRVTPRLENRIRNKQVMGLDVLLPEATSRVGGFSDACHSLTAATTLALGTEHQVIQEMEHILNKGYAG